MDLTAVRPLISGTVLSDVEVCRAELVAIGVVRGLLDAREVQVVRRLDELAATDPSLFPAGVVATASRSSLLHAERLRERADTCSSIPELGAALSDGSTTGGHVDIVVRATAGLSTSERAVVARHGPRLALAAGEQTASGFRKTVEQVVAQARTDDGLARLHRQRRQSRLRWWLDPDGMWNLAGRFDPATGARMEGRLRNRINRIRAGGLPDTTPTDPIDMQQHLAALALAELVGVRDDDNSADNEKSDSDGDGPGNGAGAGNGNGNGNGRVAANGDRHDRDSDRCHNDNGAAARSAGNDNDNDHDHDHDESEGEGEGDDDPTGDAANRPTGGRASSDTTGANDRPRGNSGGIARSGSNGGGVPDVTVIIDERTLREGHTRDGSTIDIGLGGYGLPVETIRRWACIGSITPVVVSADGTRLLLGRETRLANAAQRRALRVLYRSCALCETPFDLCQVHHINWYTLGGLTDIGNLLPLCSRHHHLVHEGGWILHLAPDRTLCVTRSGHDILVHPPPNAWAA